MTQSLQEPPRESRAAFIGGKLGSATGWLLAEGVKVLLFGLAFQIIAWSFGYAFTAGAVARLARETSGVEQPAPACMEQAPNRGV